MGGKETKELNIQHLKITDVGGSDCCDSVSNCDSKGVSKICQDYLGVCPPTQEKQRGSWRFGRQWKREKEEGGEWVVHHIYISANKKGCKKSLHLYF